MPRNRQTPRREHRPMEPPKKPEEEEQPKAETQEEEETPPAEEKEKQAEEAPQDAAPDKATATDVLVEAARSTTAGDKVVIPDALTADEAVVALKDAGFQVGEVDTQSSTIVIL